jgi:hypothetical protein
MLAHYLVHGAFKQKVMRSQLFAPNILPIDLIMEEVKNWATRGRRQNEIPPQDSQH